MSGPTAISAAWRRVRFSFDLGRHRSVLVRGVVAVYGTHGAPVAPSGRYVGLWKSVLVIGRSAVTVLIGVGSPAFYWNLPTTPQAPSASIDRVAAGGLP